MTSIAIRLHTHSVMAFIAETLSTYMTLPALFQTKVPSLPVSHNFFSDLSKKLPMMKAHILCLSYAILKLRIGHLEKPLRNFRLTGKNRRNSAVSERE
jgi:hypothetical protein